MPPLLPRRAGEVKCWERLTAQEVVVHSPTKKRLKARASLAGTRRSASTVVLLDMPDHRVRLPLLDRLEGLAQRG
jgi:hypothetical protein